VWVPNGEPKKHAFTSYPILKKEHSAGGGTISYLSRKCIHQQREWDSRGEATVSLRHVQRLERGMNPLFRGESRLDDPRDSLRVPVVGQTRGFSELGGGDLRRRIRRDLGEGEKKKS